MGSFHHKKCWTTSNITKNSIRDRYKPISKSTKTLLYFSIWSSSTLFTMKKNRLEEGFCVFRNGLISISDWVFGNAWSCSTLFIMKTSHKNDELKFLKGGSTSRVFWNTLWQRNVRVKNEPDQTATKLKRCRYVMC